MKTSKNQTLAQIATECPSYNPQAMSVTQVQDFLSKLVMPVTQTLELLELPLLKALDRVLATDVISPMNVPPHDNSAMDGYAFAGEQLPLNAALTLQIVGTALAGKAWQGRVESGQCVRIMTGAVMPEGLDTVVPQEYVSMPINSNATEFITIPAGILKIGDNRRLCGEDLMLGKAALRQGERLTPARLGLAASLGLATLTTWRPLRVAYFSTGDEILSLGEMMREGAIYDSNRYTILGMLSRLGCEVMDMGVVRDEPALLKAAFSQAAECADAIITSGGVSMGEADYTKTMMTQLGDVAFWRIAMRPGRPMAVGRMNHLNQSQNQAILFGLPGNPVAAMVNFLVFVRPALLKMMGVLPESVDSTPLLKARSAEVIYKKPGRTEYQRGRVFTGLDGTLQVKTTGHQGSGMLSSMAQANGLMVLPSSQGNVAVGDEVEVLMFEGVM